MVNYTIHLRTHNAGFITTTIHAYYNHLFSFIIPTVLCLCQVKLILINKISVTKGLLSTDDPVHYTVTELVPGMVKVNRVWVGFHDYSCNEEAAEYINAWCQEKMVPDGAREILVSLFIHL